MLKEVAEGLAIFAKYGGTDIAADHDIIYAGQGRGVAISEEDLTKLDALGWFYEGDFCDCHSDQTYTDKYGDERTKHLPTCASWAKFV